MKKWWIKVKKWFLGLSTYNKTLLIISAILFFDVFSTEIIQLKYLYEYHKEQKAYEQYLKNRESINRQKKLKANTIYKDQITDYIVKSNNKYNFISLIDKFHDKIDMVEFLVNRDRVSFITYISPTLYLKDKSIVRMDPNPLVSDKSIDKYMEILDKYNIPYKFVDHLSYASGNVYISEPQLQIAELTIVPWIMKHFLTIVLVGFLIYLIIQQSGMMRNSNKFEVLDPKEIEGDMDNLIGMKEIKEEILQLRDMINNMNKYRSYGIDTTFNIMFSGPAGTGKTKIASFLAKELNIPMIIGTGNVETGYVAGGANTIRNLFKSAVNLAQNSRKKAVIIFLDEAQVLLQRRGRGRNKWEDDSANELLAQLDGVKTIHGYNIIFIAASNFNEQNFEIDEAMERRFKKKIFFRLPTHDERKEIIEYYLGKIDKDKIDLDNLNIDYIANITSGHSPAKLETLIQEASLYAIRYNKKIDTDVLFTAFERLNVGITTRDMTKKQQKTRRVIILHELGHFITEFDYYNNKYNGDLDKIKKDISMLKISSEAITNFDSALGYVLHNEGDRLLKTKNDYEEDIIRLYGGHAAEQYFFNCSKDDNSNVTTGAYNDIQKISSILKHIVIDLGMYSKLKINLSQLNIKNDNEIIEMLESISDRLFNEAYDRIERNRDLILFLYKQLYKHWTLNRDDIFKYIEEYQNRRKK